MITYNREDKLHTVVHSLASSVSGGEVRQAGSDKSGVGGGHVGGGGEEGLGGGHYGRVQAGAMRQSRLATGPYF